MKKIFSKILIATIMLGIFLAPATPQINTEGHFGLVKNNIYAQNVKYYYEQKVTITTGINSNITRSEIKGPFDTLTACQSSEGSQIKSTIVRSCFTSEGEPTTTGTTENSAPLTPNIDPNQNNNVSDDGCGLVSNWDVCFVNLFYYILFVPLAAIARICGEILDFFVFYSISSEAYKDKAFIDTGWAVIRDLSNIFFIIALLYVAFKTVLGLNASNNKKMISMIIMMALLINFSLFFTRVVVDMSNILARVFYSNIEAVDKNGSPQESNIAGRSISVGIVNKFNPQKFINEAGVRRDEHTKVYAALVFISIILVAFMIYIFLSLAFVFVGRVISIWLLMVFSPLAFASQALPSVKIPGYGWSEWKDQLFNQAFMAPIFVFFLYLIVSFGDLAKDTIGLTLTGDSDLTGVNAGGLASNDSFLNVTMNTIIPFMIIFFLLKKAKDITIKMSGDLGSGLSKLGTITGGAALGLAAGGAAMLGRNTLGSISARASRGETLSQRAALKDFAGMNFAQKWAGQLGASVGLDKRYGNTYDTKTKMIDSGLGGRINKAQEHIAHKEHDNHDLDAAFKAAHVGENEKNNLSGFKEKEVLKKFTKLKSSEIQTDLKEGKIAGVQTKSEYEKENRKIITDNILNSTNITKSIADGDAREIIDPKTKKGTGVHELTDQGRKNMESMIDTNYNKIIKQKTEEISSEKFKKALKESKQSISTKDKLTAQLTSGSYDARNFNPVADKKANMFNKTAIFLLAGIAMNLRNGLKQGNMNPGKGQGDLITDLSSSLGSVIRGIAGTKFSVGGGGGSHGGGGHDDHGGGHDDHGGGHGGH